MERDCLRSSRGFPIGSELVQRFPEEGLPHSRNYPGPKNYDKQGPESHRKLKWLHIIWN